MRKTARISRAPLDKSGPYQPPTLLSPQVAPELSSVTDRFCDRGARAWNINHAILSNVPSRLA